MLTVRPNNRANDGPIYFFITDDFVECSIFTYILQVYHLLVKVNRTNDYFNWLRNVVLPQVFPSHDWRNTTLPPSPWFGDFANLRIGSIKLRQVRVADGKISSLEIIVFQYRKYFKKCQRIGI